MVYPNFDIHDDFGINLGLITVDLKDYSILRDLKDQYPINITTGICSTLNLADIHSVDVSTDIRSVLTNTNNTFQWIRSTGKTFSGIILAIDLNVTNHSFLEELVQQMKNEVNFLIVCGLINKDYEHDTVLKAKISSLKRNSPIFFLIPTSNHRKHILASVLGHQKTNEPYGSEYKELIVSIRILIELVKGSQFMNLDIQTINDIISSTNQGTDQILCGYGYGSNALDATKSCIGRMVRIYNDVGDVSDLILALSGSSLTVEGIHEAIQLIKESSNNDINFLWGVSNTNFGFTDGQVFASIISKHPNQLNELKDSTKNSEQTKSIHRSDITFTQSVNEVSLDEMCKILFHGIEQASFGDVYLFDEGGVSLGYIPSNRKRKIKTEPLLLTGLFTAIQQLSSDQLGYDIEEMVAGNQKCLFRTINVDSCRIHGVVIFDPSLTKKEEGEEKAIKKLKNSFSLIQYLKSKKVKGEIMNDTISKALNHWFQTSIPSRSAS